MSFLSPLFFWSFLALLPLAAVYFLKVRPRKRETTAYFLWQKIFVEKKATSLFQRLRDLLSLLLMLLAFSAIALALTGPELTNDERRDLILIVDHSASMQAVEGGSTRLEKAQKAASEIVTAINDTQRVAIASIAHDVTFRSHLSSQPRELMDAIREIENSDFPLRPEALEAVLQDEAWAGNYRMLFFTDGSFDGVEALPDSLEIVKIGEEAGNAGLVAVDLQRLPGSNERVGFYVQAMSSFEDAQEVDLELRHEDTGRILRLMTLDLQPGVNEPQILQIDNAPTGRWVAELMLEDALAADNVASLALPERNPIRVAVQAEDRFFLEASVLAFQQADGLLTLTEEDPEIILGRGSAAGDAISAVLFQPNGEAPWWESVGGELELAVPEVVTEDHPVLRFADLSAIPFRGARQVQAPENALVLAQDADTRTPLLWVARSEGRTALVVNMDPLLGEFYFSAWFPVLVHGAATWLAGQEEELAATYQPGMNVSLPTVAVDEMATVIQPDESAVEIESESRFGPVKQLGFHRITGGSDELAFGASLLSASDTNLNNSELTTTVGPISRGKAPAWWLIVIALGVLVAESLLYHRRKVG